MRALEDIRNQVRSAKSRRYIDEAIAAYSGGAYRSALIAIWIAVAADLIEKLRFLADEGDANAKAHRDKLDAAIKDNKINELQKFERELLTKAHQDLQLIGSHERDQLLRLYEDRHLCAHPAFIPDSDDLFNPTAESVRAHLRAAVDAVLSHQAVTGRKALERFGRDIASASFPRDDSRLADHLRASYMDHGTPQLRANLIKVVCKETFNQEKDSTWRWNHTRTARELQKIAPGEFEERARSVLERKQNELDDEGLIALVAGLCYVPGVWELLHAGTRARIEELLKNVPANQLVIVHQLYNGALPAAPVDRMLLDRLSEAIPLVSRQMHFAQLTPFLGDVPDRRLIPPLIELVADASSYEGGEAVLKWVNALSPSLTEDDLQQLLTAAASNNQISGSVLGTRQLEVLRHIGPQGEQATAAWAKWDTRWTQDAEPTASNP
ncbi:hypothetical protein ACH46N_21850 [Streptomyces pristinaespiralis]|uniref:Uncharacterized protein n=1 Tax=Streptomyces pristinaespiralis TaxID=38300 RepID=A0A0M4DJH5_STRPR|nr:hypothetical protein [Streptomyces pristinaespiralis]ALC18339.1 Uncharacterized protein SPRI_0033 [Streptomyces pristinaespiralis]ALC25626.1 Uncharacterized protein SPRI_7320 [Streptomyces pristinaespiralis]QMU12199.1 hypothetical protein H3L99_00145 [Streptomyces pristinaespiralis]